MVGADELSRLRDVRTVLVLDDDEACAKSLRRSFRNYDVVTTTVVYEALEVAHFNNVDLAVVDLFLGRSDVSGIDVIRELRIMSHRTSIVMMSGWPTTRATVAAMRVGANAVVEKPASANSILEALHLPAAEPPALTFMSLAEASDQYIDRVLEFSGQNVSLAARRLGLHRQALQKRLRKRRS